MSDLGTDLLAFIDAAPTPYHAVAESVRRLEAAGYRRFDEREPWALEPGERGYLIRADSSLAAFEVGAAPPAEAGFRLVGAHTDSPNLRVKPNPDVVAHGYRQLAVEPYGGVLLHTWLDRDLSIAGRVSVGDGSAGVRSLLLSFGRPMVRIPSLAIHLNRELRSSGLQLNEQQHLAPILSLEGGASLRELLVEELRDETGEDFDPDEILAWDLMLCDTQPADTAGADGEFLLAPRLDNLASCHAALSALVTAGERGATEATRGIVLYDHEEVGSRSAQGAAGPILEDLLWRLAAGLGEGRADDFPRAAARSLVVSADMAHGVHPNYADRHEPGHRPVLGRGPVIKTNANQSYASDAWSSGLFAAACRRVGVEPQRFVVRSDLPCGSTIGPISAARVGIRTVDVGNPMLSMHSCREMAATADVKPMIDALVALFE